MPQSLKSRDEMPWLYYPRSNSVRVINSHLGGVESYDFGLNFRATAGHVTDGTNQIYVIPADIYPVTRGGLTFGHLTNGPRGSADLASPVDPRLAGYHRINGQAGFSTGFRIDLPVVGDWEIRAALGYSGLSFSTAGWGFNDNTTNFHNTTAATSPGVGNVADISSTVRTVANWIASHVFISRTFGSTTLFLNDLSAGGVDCIMHLRLTKV